MLFMFNHMERNYRFKVITFHLLEKQRVYLVKPICQIAYFVGE